VSKQKPIKPMPCPRCKRRGTLQKLVDVVVTAPAGCYALNKKGIRSPRVKVKAVIWDQEAWFCTHPKCGWNNHGPGHMTIKEEDCLFRPLHVVQKG
jgi:hypothetical protein